jgi:hypothetical protein
MNNQVISQESTSLSQEGAAIEKKVKNEQGRYVTGRVVKKAAQEGMGIFQDLRDLGKKATNDVKKMFDGEPQQK